MAAVANASDRSPFPWFYPVFFCTMIAHRARRDIRRCRIKYGETWTEYERRVPYLFIPVSSGRRSSPRFKLLTESTVRDLATYEGHDSRAKNASPFGGLAGWGRFDFCTYIEALCGCNTGKENPGVFRGVDATDGGSRLRGMWCLRVAQG